jgi:hypothetical protein
MDDPVTLAAAGWSLKWNTRLSPPSGWSRQHGNERYALLPRNRGQLVYDLSLTRDHGFLGHIFLPLKNAFSSRRSS